MTIPRLVDPDDETNGFGLQIPFANFLGIHVIAEDKKRALLRLERKPELMNSWGVANGGVIMTMLDHAMGSAVRGFYGQPVSVATIDVSMIFISPAKGDFVVEGRVLKDGKSTWFCEAEARTEEGTVVAKGMGTFKVILPRARA